VEVVILNRHLLPDHPTSKSNHATQGHPSLLCSFLGILFLLPLGLRLLKLLNRWKSRVAVMLLRYLLSRLSGLLNQLIINSLA
jgi:hypothetical protein